MDNRPLWKMASGDWVQDDEKNRFLILNRETGKEDNQSRLDIIVGAKWHHNSDAVCDGFFPPEFRHCPFCGKKLAFVEYDNDVWMPPYGGGRGLRLVSERIDTDAIPIKKEGTKRWIDCEKDVFHLPRQNGDFEFIVASLGTKSSVLVAFDRTKGSLYYFTAAQGKWVSFTTTSVRRISENQLPNWSWSAAFVNGKAGLAVPSPEGPVWISLDWATGTYTPEFGEGKCIGGAATLQQQIFVPVLADGTIAIHMFDDTTRQWKQIGESIPDKLQEAGGTCYFSVPIVDEGRIYWIGIEGLLTFDLSTNCVWRPWSSAGFPCQAVPELGPPYQDSSGNFWQICYDIYDDAFRYRKLNGSDADREDVDGGCFSSGVSCFSKQDDLWDKPWAKLDARRRDIAEMIRAPLLCLDEKSKITVTVGFAKNSILPLLDIVRDRKTTHEVVLRIESSTNLPVELKKPETLTIQTPWELRLFIYQPYLYLYSPEEAVCYKWRLQK